MKRSLVYLLILLILLPPTVGAAGYLKNEMPPHLRDFQETIGAQAQKYPEYFHLSGNTPEKKIALTFDDGPHGKNTPLILDILKEQEVKATFFVLGERVQQYHEIVHRIIQEGHQIGNHSFSHSDLRQYTSDAILQTELNPTSQLIGEITGVYPKYMRAPYGALSDGSIEFIGQQGWHIINWSIDSFDWDQTENDVEKIVNKIARYHHSGAIILFHCNGRNTVEALPKIITLLQILDYDLVTVEELLNSESIPAYAG